MHSTTHISHTCAVCNWVDQTSRGDAGCLNSCLDVIPRTSRHKDSHVCLFWPWKTTKIQKGWPKIVHMEGRKYKLWRSNYFKQTLYLLDRKKTLQILLSNYTVMNASFFVCIIWTLEGACYFASKCNNRIYTRNLHVDSYYSSNSCLQ